MTRSPLVFMGHSLGSLMVRRMVGEQGAGLARNGSRVGYWSAFGLGQRRPSSKPSGATLRCAPPALALHQPNLKGGQLFGADPG